VTVAEAPRTFWVETLGCKVNAADSDRIAGSLMRRGLVRAGSAGEADLRVVNTCSVTMSAAAQSRSAARKAVSLPQIGGAEVGGVVAAGRHVIVTGCYATSHPEEAARIPGVSAVITHHDNLEQELTRHLARLGLSRRYSLPLADEAPERQASRQRAFVKIQDGCDAHCTYCIIPNLRPRLSSLETREALQQIGRLIEAGHQEIVLTGIFLGAYGQSTALRRRQGAARESLASLVEAICRAFPKLPRLRLSSIEAGDLSEELLAVLRSHGQVVPHFHVPLQSGSDAILRRMNRQYTRGDFLRLVDRLHGAFDRPALTTDIVTGFPGEDDGDFADTLSVVDHARFLHVHAFPFSPRPGTAAARWTEEFVPNAVATERVKELQGRAQRHSLAFRRSFVGQRVRVIVEQGLSKSGHRHGRCERYFDVELPGMTAEPGSLIEVEVSEVTSEATTGVLR
jgi:threonylcarbamoyladenosine tRNA methylthiotransferase MtaB